MSTLASNGTSGAGLFTYNYVANSARLLRLDLPNGTRVKHSYDALERLTQVQNERTSGASPNLASYVYTFDAPGLPQRDVRTGVTSQLGTDALKKIAYLYDGVDQLTSEEAKEEVTPGTLNPVYKNTFSFDAMGNRTSATRVQGTNTTVTTGTPNALNQLTSLSTSVNSGSAQTSALSYDAGGNLTQSTSSSGAQTLYFYDDLDRLVKIENKSAAGAYTSKSEFVYDYASRKAVSAEFTWTAGAWLKTEEKRRVFDGLDVVQERNDANQVTAQYVRDGNIGGILARTSASGKSYFHYDGGGNVTALSDENGALVGRYSYDAFGNTLEASGARAAENPYRFSTKEHIAGMVDFGYRFYSPGMGRWLNRDPIGESGGSNLYGMIGNNPVNSWDEYGLKKSTKFPKLPISTLDKYFNVKGTKKQRKDVWNSLRIISRTKTGRKLIVLIKNSKNEVTIVCNIVGKNNSETGIGIININTNGKTQPELPVTKGGKTFLEKATLDIVIVHELGHQVGGTFDDGPNNMNNVNAWENPYREEWGAPMRMGY